MAVDVMCSEISSPSVMSPRISFSHDLNEVELVKIDSDHSLQLLNDHPTIDFDFCVDQSFLSQDQISSADELFSNGRILPVQIKKSTTTLKSRQAHHESDQVITKKKPEPAIENSKKKRLIEFLSTNVEEEEEEKPHTKPFWQFRRSTSVNGENSRSVNNNNNSNNSNGINNNYGLLRTLNFLKRSNSTGSAPNPKPSALPNKSMMKQHSLREGSIYRAGSSSVNYHQYYFNHNNNNNSNNVLKKPPLKKSMSNGINRSYGNNGVGISPVLNINPSYIAKGTVSLLGIGSLFCSKKSKKKKN